MADANPQDDTNQDNKGQQQEEQKGPVRGKLLSEEESHEWGLGVTIKEKTPKTEENILRRELEIAANGEDDEQETEKNTEEESEKSAKALEEEVSAPEVVTIEDPGEFQPGDYSFEVTVFNEKGEKPRTVKVSSIDDWEKLLEDEPNLGSSVAVNKAFRAAQKMELNLERDHQKWSEDKAEYEEAVKEEQQRESRNDTIFNEMNYLIDKGDLPKLTQEEMTSLNWDDPAVLKAHPNIAPHRELLSFMRTENASRLKAGLAPLQSALDAFNAMQLDERRKTDTEAKKAAGEARKTAGSRVASGTSTPLSSAQPKGIAVGRVGDLSRLGQNWSV